MDDIPASKPLPKWKCHKVVEAFQITNVVYTPNSMSDSDVTLANPQEGFRVVVSAAWYEKFVQEPGGYYVRYSDGYQSWSPAEAFESGYTRLPGGAKDHLGQSPEQFDETPRPPTTMLTPVETEKLCDHKVDGLNEAIEIEAVRNTGPGGAHHTYLIRGLNQPTLALYFQNGPIEGPESINGISNEALLAIVIDRLRGFQSGPYSCRENACALTHLEESMMWLHKRTRDRIARGVEGTLKI